jgi:hypothetical protein
MTYLICLERSHKILIIEMMLDINLNIFYNYSLVSNRVTWIRILIMHFKII